MSNLRLALGAVAFATPVTVTLLDVLGYVAKVEGASMQPVLNPSGQKEADYVYLNRWQARGMNFKHGDIVSLSSPTNPDQKIIKRIIALEGDTVTSLSYKRRYVRVPEGHCWVEGDHHGASMDSNFFGPVALGLITARASHIVWPWRRFQRMDATPPQGRVNSQPSLPPHLRDLGEAEIEEMDRLAGFGGDEDRGVGAEDRRAPEKLGIDAPS